jgi:hypothetical protein
MKNKDKPGQSQDQMKKCEKADGSCQNRPSICTFTPTTNHSPLLCVSLPKGFPLFLIFIIFAAEFRIYMKYFILLLLLSFSMPTWASEQGSTALSPEDEVLVEMDNLAIHVMEPAFDDTLEAEEEENEEAGLMPFPQFDQDDFPLSEANVIPFFSPIHSPDGLEKPFSFSSFAFTPFSPPELLG